MKKYIVLFSLLLFSVLRVHSMDTTSVDDAVKKGLLSFKGTAKGGYTGDVLELELKNTTSESFYLKIPPGHIFDSETETQQDLVVTKNYLVELKPKQTEKVSILAMCCQAHNGAPAAKHHYRPGKLSENKNLVKLAQFIERYSYQHFYPAQSAIWVISDKHALETVSGEDKKNVRNLQYFLITLLGLKIEMPWYEVEYAKGDTTSAFSGKPERVSGEIEYYLTNNATVSFAAYTAQGQIAKIFTSNEMQGPGKKNIPFEWIVKGLPSGTYKLRVFGDNQLKKEKEIKF